MTRTKLAERIIFCTLALSAALSICAAERVFPVAAKPALDDVYPARVVNFPGGITSYADVVYSVIPGYRPMVVDIYTSTKTKTARPLVLFIHGGGWVGGHTRHSGALSDFPKVLAQLAAEGFVVASLEYRLAGEAPYPAQLQDARAAIRFLKSNAARYGIDPTRVGVWGGSAGGHLGALAALSCGVTSFDPAPAAPGSECVQAAAVWYGIFDYGAVLARPGPAGPNTAPNALLRCVPADCAKDLVAAASPITFIDSKDPPFLLIHGEADATVSVEQSRNVEAALRKSGVSVESIYIPGADHSFITATPEATRTATLRATNATFDFLHRTLRGKNP
jgi:acetyl esterase/lipase